MERGALGGIYAVDVDEIFEVEEREDHIPLGCDVKGVETCVGGESGVDVILFYKESDYHLRVPH